MSKTSEKVNKICELKEKHEKVIENTVNKMIYRLPNTVDTYYHLDYTLCNYKPAQLKQAAIFSHFAKMLFEKYEMDEHFLGELLKHMEIQRELAKSQGSVVDRFSELEQEYADMDDE